MSDESEIARLEREYRKAQAAAAAAQMAARDAGARWRAAAAEARKTGRGKASRERTFYPVINI